MSLGEVDLAASHHPWPDAAARMSIGPKSVQNYVTARLEPDSILVHTTERPEADTRRSLCSWAQPKVRITGIAPLAQSHPVQQYDMLLHARGSRRG